MKGPRERRGGKRKEMRGRGKIHGVLIIANNQNAKWQA